MTHQKVSSSEESLNEICQKIRAKVIDPALHESQEIVNHAHKKAEELVKAAEKQAAHMLEEARAHNERERSVFIGSLQQSSKHVLETLRQSIEEELFSKGLFHLISKASSEPKVIVKLIEDLSHAIAKEGLESNLEVVLPKITHKEEILNALSEKAAHQLRKGLKIGNFKGGVEMRLTDKNITLDFTDETIAHMLIPFLRKDFREIFFNAIQK